MVCCLMQCSKGQFCCPSFCLPQSWNTIYSGPDVTVIIKDRPAASTGWSGRSFMKRTKDKAAFAFAVAVAMTAAIAAGPEVAQKWEPTRTIEFIVPAGTGGGADQMARGLQG